MNEVYKLVLPIYEAKRLHPEMEKLHRKLAECYKELVYRGENRFLGSYFRVGFYGLLFGDLDQKEFIYKEAALTRLSEFSLKLQVHETGEHVSTQALRFCIVEILPYNISQDKIREGKAGYEGSVVILAVGICWVSGLRAAALFD